MQYTSANDKKENREHEQEENELLGLMNAVGSSYLIRAVDIPNAADTDIEPPLTLMLGERKRGVVLGWDNLWLLICIAVVTLFVLVLHGLPVWCLTCTAKRHMVRNTNES